MLSQEDFNRAIYESKQENNTRNMEIEQISELLIHNTDFITTVNLEAKPALTKIVKVTHKSRLISIPYIILMYFKYQIMKIVALSRKPIMVENHYYLLRNKTEEQMFKQPLFSILQQINTENPKEYLKQSKNHKHWLIDCQLYDVTYKKVNSYLDSVYKKISNNL